MSVFSNPSTLTTLEKLIGMCIAGLTGWAAFQSNLVKNDLEALNKEIAKNSDQRETRKLDHEINLKIYEELKDVYKTPNLTPEDAINRITAIVIIVEPNQQAEVRDRLGEALISALENINVTAVKPSEGLRKKTEAAKSMVAETLFKAYEVDSADAKPKVKQELQAVANSSSAEKPKWSNYDFDFFWCEQGPNPEANKRTAEQASKLLQSMDPSADGRWRVRKLPAAINAKPGYRIDGYQINASSPDEIKIANVMNTIFKQNAMPSADQDFKIRPIDYPTPWYLSVFFCPGGLNGGE